MSDRAPSMFGLIGIAVAILGWLVVWSALPPLEGPAIYDFSDGAAKALQAIGLLVIVVGSAGAVWAGLRGAVALVVGGMVVNLAALAGFLHPTYLGLLGATGILLGAVWASRQIRSGLDRPRPQGDE